MLCLYCRSNHVFLRPGQTENAENIPPQTQSAPEAVITDPTKGIGAVKSVTLHTPLEQDRVGRGPSHL